MTIKGEIWKTAAEWAAEGLPGLPGTERNVRRLATLKEWRFRDRQASGGGREYPLSALPEQARAAYLARHLVAIDVPAALQNEIAADPANDILSGRAAEARDARLALLGLADSYAEQAGIPKDFAYEHFCHQYNGGDMVVADWIRVQVKSIKVRTLWNWRKAQREGRAVTLGVDRGGARRGCGILDRAHGGEVKKFVLALVAKQPHLSAGAIRDAVVGYFGDPIEVANSSTGELTSVPVPPLRTFQNDIKRWKIEHEVVLTAITDPDRFNSKYRPAGRNSYSWVTRPNQLWQIDASPADVLTLDGRMTIYVALDIATRRIMIYVTRTPRSEAVQLLIRRAILAWGVPAKIKTDNGSDFVANATTRLFAWLGIETETSTPFSPWEKGHVERAIGTVQHGLMPLLDGFIGHNVADRKKIEARRAFAQRLGVSDEKAFSVELTAADLQTKCDRWVEIEYMQRPHAGLKGKTPLQKLAESADAIRTVDERALDALLLPAASGATRKVTKFGVRIGHLDYRCSPALLGTTVHVRMDPSDLGRVLLFAEDGAKYLGEAICYEAAGISARESEAARHEDQRRFIAGQKAELDAHTRALKGTSLLDLTLRHKAEAAGKLVVLPRPQVEHTTPQIAAAIDAVTERPAEQLQPAAAAAHAAVVAAIEAGEPPVVTNFPEPPRQRYARAVDLEKRIAAGEAVDPKEALWLGGYQQSNEYRSHRGMAAIMEGEDQWQSSR